MSEIQNVTSQDSNGTNEPAFEAPSTMSILSRTNKRDGFSTGTGAETPDDSQPVTSPNGISSEKVTIPLDAEAPKGIESIVQTVEKKSSKPVEMKQGESIETPATQSEPDDDDKTKFEKYKEEIRKERQEREKAQKRVIDNQRNYHKIVQSVHKLVDEGVLDAETAQKVLDSKVPLAEYQDEVTQATKMAMQINDSIDLISSRDPTAKLEYKAFLDYYQGLPNSEQSDIDVHLLSMENVNERIKFVTSLGRENVDEAYIEVHKFGNEREGIKHIYTEREELRRRAEVAEEKLQEFEKMGLMDSGRRNASVKTRSKPELAAKDNDVEHEDGTVDTLAMLKLSNNPRRFANK